MPRPGQVIIRYAHRGRVSIPEYPGTEVVGVRGGDALNLGAPLVERLAHGAWSIVPSESPGPPRTVGNATIYDETLRSVACLKSAPCVAVGDGNGSPFSELIEPSRASLLLVPGP